ncbi:MAG TPA: hypothetical protein DCL49_02425, partial [Candidatus Omnitrophica bacterium]|nr:hypothetical protein [Candidatus Omnitrophota bacterium]
MLHLWSILKVNHIKGAKTRVKPRFRESAFLSGEDGGPPLRLNLSRLSGLKENKLFGLIQGFGEFGNNLVFGQ